MPSGEVWSLDVVDLIGRRGSELANGAGDDAGLAGVIEKTANKTAEDDGVKRFLAIYALGREGDMPAGVVWDELALESFDAVAVVWSDRSVAFIKGGYQTDGAVVV